LDSGGEKIGPRIPVTNVRPTKRKPPSINSEGEYMNMKGMMYAERL